MKTISLSALEGKGRVGAEKWSSRGEGKLTLEGTQNGLYFPEKERKNSAAGECGGVGVRGLDKKEDPVSRLAHRRPWR